MHLGGWSDDGQDQHGFGSACWNAPVDWRGAVLVGGWFKGVCGVREKKFGCIPPRSGQKMVIRHRKFLIQSVGHLSHFVAGAIMPMVCIRIGKG